MDIEQIRELIHLMVEHDLTEIDVQDGQWRIALKRGVGGSIQQVVVPAVPAEPGAPSRKEAAGEPQEPEDEKTAEIVSPMVGTFYAAPDPDSPPFVTVGSRVEVGTPVCIIEAMKVFNEIKSELSGTITKILVQNEEAVEYSQPLFVVSLDWDQGGV